MTFFAPFCSARLHSLPPMPWSLNSGADSPTCGSDMSGPPFAGLTRQGRPAGSMARPHVGTMRFQTLVSASQVLRRRHDPARLERRAQPLAGPAIPHGAVIDDDPAPALSAH